MSLIEELLEKGKIKTSDVDTARKMLINAQRIVCNNAKVSGEQLKILKEEIFSKADFSWLAYALSNGEIRVLKEQLFYEINVVELVIAGGFIFEEEAEDLKEALEVAWFTNLPSYSLTKEEIKDLELKVINQVDDGNLKGRLAESSLKNLKLRLLKEALEVKYDGTLSEDEMLILNNNLKEKDLEKLKLFLNKYKDSLRGYKDLVGDNLVPDTAYFNLMMKYYGEFLSNNPNDAITKDGVALRRAIHPLILKMANIKNPQVIENRNYLKCFERLIGSSEQSIIWPDTKKTEPDELEMSNESVIWVVNHGFADDAIASLKAIDRHAYMVFANIPEVYNTKNGIATAINGAISCNRKSKENKEAVIAKAAKVLEYGTDVAIWVEGIWNKSPNKPVLEPWSGYYYLSVLEHKPVYLVFNYVTSPDAPPYETIHTVKDGPFYFDGMSEAEANNFIKERFTYWHELCMHAYGTDTRVNYLKYEKPDKFWKKEITTRVKSVERYDSEAERNADYRLSGVANPEDVYEAIAGIEAKESNIQDVAYARKLVNTRKRENPQRYI